MITGKRRKRLTQPCKIKIVKEKYSNLTPTKKRSKPSGKKNYMQFDYITDNHADMITLEDAYVHYRISTGRNIATTELFHRI